MGATSMVPIMLDTNRVPPIRLNTPTQDVGRRCPSRSARPQVFMVCSSDCLTTSKFNSLRTQIEMRVPTTPIPAASVTEAIPA